MFRTIHDDNEAGESCRLRDQLRTMLEQIQALLQLAESDPTLSGWVEDNAGEIDTARKTLPDDDAIEAIAAQKARDRAEDEENARADYQRDMQGDWL